MISPAALPGWADDDLAPALAAYLAAPPDGWPKPAAGQTARDFFETSFDADPVEGGEGFATGYYEPELSGASTRSDRFSTPLYAPPSDPAAFSRAEIEDGALAGRGLELAWLEDPVDAFFLHIQGSGRIRLEDGGVLRLGFVAKNDRPYQSLGRLLVERGEISASRIDAEAVKSWLRARPEEGRALMRQNASFVFFEEKSDLGLADGPIGALGVSLTPHRSAAVDPAHHLLGAPLWIDCPAAPNPRLMIAQDIGGAIRGANRVDLFFGSGAEAGAAAGPLRHPARVHTLRPRSA